MKKYIIYGIIGCVVCVGLAYTFLGQEPLVVENEMVGGDDISVSTSTPTTTQKTNTKKTQTGSTAPKALYVVSYTAKGFEPSELQVPKGSSVKFVNKTNTSMRIFASESAKPPYSDLNQPKALGLNGEYVFNFVYSGVWEYYNSLKPSDKANIVVY